MSSRRYLVYLFLYINLMNLVYLGFSLFGSVVIRPLVGYDYILLAMLIALRTPVLLSWSFFLLLLILDLLHQVSFLYLFSLPELLRNARFSLLYDLRPVQFLMMALFAGFAYLNYRIIKWLTQSAARPSWPIVLFFTGYFAVIYTMDFFNGGSNFNLNKFVPFTQYNIGGSSLRELGYALVTLSGSPPRPAPGSKSIAFCTFENDSTGNQLFVLLESWGLPNDSLEWHRLREELRSEGMQLGWQTSIGKTPFKGSTTHAELRELMNVTGQYNFLLNKDSAATIVSLFNVKKSQGYTTYAVHSFSERMFERIVWWRNIGIDSSYFIEQIARRNGLTNDQFNYDTPFISLHDEMAFTFLQDRAGAGGRTFAYLLTENSHLPLRDNGMFPNSAASNSRISPEAGRQLSRIRQLLNFMMTEAGKDKWSRILIVGDHMPPFTRDLDRAYYSNTCVPYIILTPAPDNQ